MSETLTLQQQTAVFNRGGRLLVSAAAGSGKTKVLVDRLMSYLTDSGCPANIDDFLIITYTKAAAAELRGKISKKLMEKIAEDPSNRHLQRQMQRLYLAKISTVHSFCADILREYAYRLDLSADFRVADELECSQLQMLALERTIASAYDSIGQNPFFQAFVDTQGIGRDDRLILDIILKVYNSAICHLQPIQWLDEAVAASDVLDVTDASQTVWGEYLMDRFKEALRLHINALRKCYEQAVRTDGFAKPAALLQSTIDQLQRLDDCRSWDQLVTLGKIDYGRLTFTKACTDTQLVEQIKAVRGACKDDVEKRHKIFADKSDRLLADLRESNRAATGLAELVKSFVDNYSRLKRQKRILDFSDLEHYALDLLLGKTRTGATAAAKEISDRFREIMVDEYQDSNGVQDAIFNVLTMQRNNCFMVGDVKQSIYQFRLADPQIFIEKYTSYAPADSAMGTEGRKVLLSSNFRSSGGIIGAVNDVFGQCMSKKVGGIDYTEAEQLREGIAHVDIGEPEVELYGIEVQRDTYGEEAAFVCSRIQQLLDGKHMVRDGDVLRPIKASDIVILLRSPGSVGAHYQYALEQQGIRCFTGDGSEPLQKQEVQTLINILQIIDNPLQDIPLMAALVSPVFAFSNEEVAQIRYRSKKYSLYESLKRDESPKTRNFLEVLSSLRADAKMDTLCQLLAHILDKTNLLRIYSSMKDGADRVAEIQHFCQIASDFENTGRKDLSYFLQYLESLEQRGLGTAEAPANADGVTIMSIHKSKGLEFPVVFLCGLSRRFNDESARAQVLCHKNLGLGLNVVNARQRVRYPTLAKRAISAKILEEGLSEELRVLYVAMTRARDRLVMIYSVKDLASDLREIGMRLEHTPKQLLTADVSCPGEWILQTALTRTEAGAFFALGGNPGIARLSEPVWKIDVGQAQITEGISVSEGLPEGIAVETLDRIKEGIEFRYPHMTSTVIPSKQTATQMKGRQKDAEISEGAVQSYSRSFRKASFVKNGASRKEYGTILHKLLQYVSYSACADVDSLREELARLVEAGLLSQEESGLIELQPIVRFFRSPLGRDIATKENVLREFKFSVLMDSQKYYLDIENERILVQGVVDCAFVEDAGITIIDFKTDRILESTVEERSAQYSPQVRAYADALEEIFCKKVNKVWLYYFHTGSLVEIER